MRTERKNLRQLKDRITKQILHNEEYILPEMPLEAQR